MNIIVAVSENGVIGLKGKMPWHLPKDLQYFKKVTINHTVIMGKNTYLSIGNPLPNRKNIVLSKTLESHKNILVASSWDEVFSLIKPDEKVFIIGGQQIYEQAFEKNLVKSIYRTIVHHNFEGDTFFPHIQWNKWILISSEYSSKDDKNPYDITFEIWNRK